jgi:hypothetical protein
MTALVGHLNYVFGHPVLSFREVWLSLALQHTSAAARQIAKDGFKAN